MFYTPFSDIPQHHFHVTRRCFYWLRSCQTSRTPRVPRERRRLSRLVRPSPEDSSETFFDIHRMDVGTPKFWRFQHGCTPKNLQYAGKSLQKNGWYPLVMTNSLLTWKWTFRFLVRWFTELKDGDFPVRYVNVYQRVDFEGDYNNLGKYNISLIWSFAIWRWFPINKTWFQGSVVVRSWLNLPRNMEKPCEGKSTPDGYPLVI